MTNLKDGGAAVAWAMLERVTYALHGINQGGGAITVEELADTNRDAQALLAGESDNMKNCICGTELIVASSIGEFCPNKDCPVVDGPFDGSAAKTWPVAETALEAAERERDAALADAARLREALESLAHGQSETFDGQLANDYELRKRAEAALKRGV